MVYKGTVKNDFEHADMKKSTNNDHMCSYELLFNC